MHFCDTSVSYQSLVVSHHIQFCWETMRYDNLLESGSRWFSATQESIVAAIKNFSYDKWLLWSR